jgi:hypothetical protein
MRTGFVHAATVTLAPGGDERAPGAAVTVALCGHWEHEGDCRWPHHTAIAIGPAGDHGLRTVFAAEPGDEAAVRQRIATALVRGAQDGPAGATTWTVLRQGADALTAAERAMADRWR